MTTQINEKAKQIFLSIINKMDESDYLKINNDENFMPLTVEKIDRGINTFWGTGFMVSFCHYYEQNGDLMQDPEVVFLVVDNRTENKPENLDMLGVWPFSFQQANMGIYTECMRIENGKTLVSKKAQKDVAIFCNQWLKNIKFQQSI